MGSAEEKIISLRNNYQTSLLLKITLFVLLLSNVVLGGCLYLVINKSPIVIGLSDHGVPEAYPVKEAPLSHLVNYQYFITVFLNHIYDWDYKNYANNIKKALPMMSASLREEYMEEIKRGGYIDQVNEYQLTSSLTIRQIDSESINPYQGGYRIKVIAQKLKIHDFIDRSIPVEIHVAFRPTNISSDNIWGLEIFEIKERNL